MRVLDPMGPTEPGPGKAMGCGLVISACRYVSSTSQAFLPTLQQVGSPAHDVLVLPVKETEELIGVLWWSASVEGMTRDVVACCHPHLRSRQHRFDLELISSLERTCKWNTQHEIDKNQYMDGTNRAENYGAFFAPRSSTMSFLYADTSP